MVNLLVLPFTYVFLALSHWVDIKNSTTLLWCWIAEGKVFFFFSSRTPRSYFFVLRGYLLGREGAFGFLISFPFYDLELVLRITCATQIDMI